MRDRSMRSGTELAQDIQLTNWSRAREHVENLSNQFSGVQISCDICTRFGRYLYSTKQCWIIKANISRNCIDFNKLRFPWKQVFFGLGTISEKTSVGDHFQCAKFHK